MKGKASLKVKGGKLIQVKIDYDKIIKNIEITGDFFIHPESSLEEIERCLIGVEVNEEEKEISERIKGVVKSEQAQLIGLSPEDIARVVKEALH